jgi:hypothetical protein
MSSVNASLCCSLHQLRMKGARQQHHQQQHKHALFHILDARLTSLYALLLLLLLLLLLANFRWLVGATEVM